MQIDLDRESSSLQDLESQKQDSQERLEEMDQQRSKLQGMVNDVKLKCQEESQLVSAPNFSQHFLKIRIKKKILIVSTFLAPFLQISSLQNQIRSQEIDLQSQEDEMRRTKAELSRLQEEEAQLEQSLLSGRVQLDSIVKSLKTTQEEINQVRAVGEATGHMWLCCLDIILFVIVVYHEMWREKKI